MSYNLYRILVKCYITYLRILYKIAQQIIDSFKYYFPLILSNNYRFIMEGQQQSYEQKLAEEQKKIQVEEYKQSILSQILTPQAKDRLAKIKLVKPQKVAGIQNSLIQAAQNGMLKNRLSQQQLIALLQKQSESNSQKHKVTFKRRGIDDEF